MALLVSNFFLFSVSIICLFNSFNNFWFYLFSLLFFVFYFNNIYYTLCYLLFIKQIYSFCLLLVKTALLFLVFKVGIFISFLPSTTLDSCNIFYLSFFCFIHFKVFLLFFLISSLTHRLFREVCYLISKETGNLPDIFLLWTSNLVLYCINVWSNLENATCALENNLYPEVFWCSINIS